MPVSTPISVKANKARGWSEMSIGRRVLVVVMILVLGSSYDLWRGYREQGSIAAAIVYAVLGWIVFGIPVFLWQRFVSGDGKPKRHMTQDEILGSILLPLADEFEVGNGRGRAIDSASTAYEPLRKCLAMLIAEGSVTEFMVAAQRTGMYRLTNEGYNKYKPRIEALRELPTASE
jgi:hypothetical protein